MRIPLLLTGFFISTSIFAVEDAPVKKRGGFSGVTPKPVVKKAASSGTETAKPKAARNASAGADASDEKQAPKKQQPAKSEGAKKQTGEASSSTAKKKGSTPERSPEEEKKAPPSEATAKPAKTFDAENNVATPFVKEHAPAATVAPEEIAEFSAQSPRIQALITAALDLTKLNLTYTYGSAAPAQGGMDCSGTIYHLLRSQGFTDVPRDSSGQYVWVRKTEPFFAVVSKSAESFEFKDLRPGDLLFWTGTYENGREIPISHVMLYLGTEKKAKKRIMFGSSDGRSYNGVQRWGVSVFDFKMPRADPLNPEKTKVDFVGYGRIPGLREAPPVVAAAETAAEEKAVEKPSPKKKSAANSGSSGTTKKTGSSKKPSRRE